MKNSDSTNTLEENLDFSELQEERRKITEELTGRLRKSFSEDISPKYVEENIPLTPPPKIKSRSRLSSAFRSLRVTKSSRKKVSEIDSGLITSGEEQESEKLGGISKKKKSKLAKKFSLSGIKKYRVNPKKSEQGIEENLVSSSTQTSATLKRRTAVAQQGGGNLSISQISLVDLPSDDNDINNEEYNNKNQNDINHDGVNNVVSGGVISGDTFTNDIPESPVKFEKVRKLQITIQGKKIERTSNLDLKRYNLPTTTTSITGNEDYLTATEVEPTKPSLSLTSSSKNLIVNEQQHTLVTSSNSGSGGKRQSRKKNKTKSPNRSASTVVIDQSPGTQEKLTITQSIKDTPPLERAPPKPIHQQQQPTDSSKKLSPDLNKGAIRKQNHKLKRQGSFENIFDSDQLMRQRDKSSSLERGRRYPRGVRPSEEDLLAEQTTINKNLSESPKIGNNLRNPNLSGSIGVVEAKEFSFDSNKSISPVTVVENKIIQFSVGKSVRSQPLSQATTADSNELGSLELRSRSPSPVSEGSTAVRRRIRYIEQPTFYTDEERDLLDGKRDASSYLSGISEYSFDSEFSNEHQMPAFGDLTMDHEEAPIMTSSSGEKREHLYKILVIGELGTGKTSFIKRYVHQFFSQNYRATIGVDFALKVLHWDQNTIIRLQLWDIAGQERFGNMTRVYYKEAVGAFIVFDVTRSGTFDCVSKWKEDLDSKVQLPDGSPIPCILLANKCDQEKQGIITSNEKMDEYVKENGFAGWFETSAKENVNIEDAARGLVNKILLNDKLISAADLDAEKFAIAGSSSSGSQGKKSNCAC